MGNEHEEMKRRIENGEFGSPKSPDIMKINEAWAQILKSVQGKQPNYHSISGLWKEKNSNKVAFAGRTQEDIHIPAGTRLLCFNRESDNERAPDLGLVYVTYED